MLSLYNEGAKPKGLKTLKNFKNGLPAFANQSLRVYEAMAPCRHCERSEAIPQSRKRIVINNFNFHESGIASQARNDTIEKNLKNLFCSG